MTTSARTKKDNDALAAHRVYKKVVTPGLNSVKYVDRSGFIAQSPRPGTGSESRVSGGSAASSEYLRKLGEAYKEHHLEHGHCKVATSRDHSATMHRSSTSSSTKNNKRQKQSTSPRKGTSSSPEIHDKSRSNTSKSLEHYLRSIAPSNYDEKERDKGGTWNLSEQGLRLEREKTALDSSRAMRRTSEIVQHRIDKMYFMNGSAIKLQPKYKVENEDLIQLKASTKISKEPKPTPESTPRTYRTEPFVMERDSIEDHEKEERNKIPAEITGVKITTRRKDSTQDRTIENTFREDRESDGTSSITGREFQNARNTSPVNDESQENEAIVMNSEVSVTSDNKTTDDITEPNDNTNKRRICEMNNNNETDFH